jgi:hypothetical protein
MNKNSRAESLANVKQADNSKKKADSQIPAHFSIMKPIQAGGYKKSMLSAKLLITPLNILSNILETALLITT